MLEQEGTVTTRTGAGTRVAPGASLTSREVVELARRLAEAALETGTTQDEVIGVIKALWPRTE